MLCISTSFWVFVDFSCEITEKSLKLTKKVEKREKKCFAQLLGARSTQKLVEIHNRSETLDCSALYKYENNLKITKLYNFDLYLVVNVLRVPMHKKITN